MDLLAWTMFVLAAAGAWAIVAYLYRRRETPGYGRTLLAGLRWSVLCLLALLILDPHLPVPGGAAAGPTEYVLVDASLSMKLPAASGDSLSRWNRAVAAARRLAGDAPVVLFGESPRFVSVDSLEHIQPFASTSRLMPALRTVAEAGATRATVFTDGAIVDADRANQALSTFGLTSEIRIVGEADEANRTLAEVEAPAWAEIGDSIRIRVGITVSGKAGARSGPTGNGSGPGRELPVEGEASEGAADSLMVRVERNGETVARTRVATPAPGRITTAELRFQPEAPAGASQEVAGGLARYDVALEGLDAVPDDDRRSVYIRTSERPAGVTLISFRPGWEPRFLAPALERALSVPVNGFIQVGEDRYVELGTGNTTIEAIQAGTVRGLAERADMVVLHGLSAEAPEWASALASEADRVLVFPAADASGLDLPIEASGRRGGEWYVSDSVPASPVAALLAGIPLEDLPPLDGPMAMSGDADAWSALSVRLNRRGAPEPVLAAGGDEERRWAVALARGFWRWAFRGGNAGQAYHRLWSAVAGWLMERHDGPAFAAIRPQERVIRRGVPVRWVAPGLAADSIALTIERQAGPVVADTVVDLLDRNTAALEPLPPGHYRYSARALSDGDVVARANGPFTVAAYSPEFSRPRLALAGLEVRGESGNESASTVEAKTAGPPLHTTPWPYIVLLALLSTEWILRRRWGLR